MGAAWERAELKRRFGSLRTASFPYDDEGVWRSTGPLAAAGSMTRTWRTRSSTPSQSSTSSPTANLPRVLAIGP